MATKRLLSVINIIRSKFYMEHIKVHREESALLFMLNIDDFTVMNKLEKLRVFSKRINYKDNDTQGGKSLM